MNAHSNPRADELTKLEGALADLRKYRAGSFIAQQAEWRLIEAAEALLGTDWCEARELVRDELLTEHAYCTRERSFVDSNGYAIGEPEWVMQYDGSCIVRERAA